MPEPGDPRHRRADRRQRPQREAEHQCRVAKVDAARRCHAARHPWRDIARDLGTSERTLRSWRHSPAQQCKRRGRPLLSAPVERRNEVIHFVHQVSGPCVGLPALRALFPHIPRCVLEDLLRRYRRVWKRRYRRDGYRLEWFQPGRVWAMDHSQATHLVDGSLRQIFAVRDLASHRQLAWQAVSSTDGDKVRAVLQELFLQYGPPLGIKSDNGSAFIAAATRAFLENAGVLPLFSPAGYPQYNGQLERSNSINKVYTHQQAVSEGHPQQWTQANLDAARQLTNGISRPWGYRGPSPDEAWLAREEITPAERSVFRQEVEVQRAAARLALRIEPEDEPTPRQVDEIERQAVAGALEALGYVNKTPVKRAPRTRKRSKRESLERALRQQREARAPREVDVPGGAGVKPRPGRAD